MLLPRALGGAEQTFADVMRIVERLSWAASLRSTRSMAKPTLPKPHRAPGCILTLNARAGMPFAAVKPAPAHRREVSAFVTFSEIGWGANRPPSATIRLRRPVITTRRPPLRP
jgi:hypothetical protein